MAKNSVEKSSTSALAKVGLGPKLIGLGAVLFVITRIIKWLPLGWVDGPINGLLWLAIFGCVVAGGALTYVKAKAS